MNPEDHVTPEPRFARLDNSFAGLEVALFATLALGTFVLIGALYGWAAFVLAVVASFCIVAGLVLLDTILPA